MNKVLTLPEQEDLTKVSNSLNLDAETKKFAFAYFIDYKSKIKQIPAERLSFVIGCAILAAAKSQVLTTVKGDTIRGVGISISQLLRGLEMSNSVANIEEFLMVLKDFITVITLSPEVSVELKSIIDKFAFAYTFFIKFNGLFRQLELEQQMSEDDEYLRCLNNFGWLIFTNSRISVLQGRSDLIESVFLLSATLSHMVYYIPKELTISYFKKNNKNIFLDNTEQKNEEAIQEGILELLKLNHNSLKDAVAHQKSLQEYLKKLIDNGIIRSSGNGFEGMYDPKLLFSNFEKLDAYYQKKLGFDDLDERFFINNKKGMSAGMFTPFAKQGSANKLNISINIVKNGGDFNQTPVKKSSPPQKVLSYDVSEKITMRTNLSDIKYAGQAVPASPFGKMPPATPVTRALEMYNWLNDTVRTKRNPSGLTPHMERYLKTVDLRLEEEILTRVTSTVEKVLLFVRDSAIKANAPLNENKLREKNVQMINLYLRVLEELLSQEERKTRVPNHFPILSNGDFHKALIACSIEVVFFVHNNSSITFPQLLELCEIQAFEFWRIIGSFINFDPRLPLPLRKHIQSLELKILMCLAWKKDSVVHKLINKFIEESESESAIEIESPTKTAPSVTENQPTQENNTPNTSPQKSTTSSAISVENSSSPQTKLSLPKTELTHSQELFFKRVLHHTALHIYQLTDLLLINEKIAENIWNVMKYILSSEPTLLINRHVDQLILSTVYGVCKILNYNLRFQDIITKYQEIPSFDKTDFFENIYNVYIKDGETSDLIKFYNTSYISQVKAYLFTLTPQAELIPRPGTPQVKKPLVPALAVDSPLRALLPQQPGTPYKGGMSKTGTPMSKYAMTPRTGALYAFGESPSRNLEMMNNFASKTRINFDDAHESGHTEDFIVKKAKLANPILDKIIEQRGEDSEMSSNKIPLFVSPVPHTNSTLNKFSTYEEPKNTNNAINLANLVSLMKPVQNAGLNFNFGVAPQPKPEAQISNEENMKMNVEQNPQQSGQSQSSPKAKSEAQTGFKKVQKKEGPMIPELNK